MKKLKCFDDIFKEDFTQEFIFSPNKEEKAFDKSKLINFLYKKGFTMKYWLLSNGHFICFTNKNLEFDISINLKEKYNIYNYLDSYMDSCEYVRFTINKEE